ncbi:ferredoxin reductase family protein [Saccharothrix longispora]|uniref:ferredoxin reductase family protein n=1 Tax=Saccharothrix longispora TaxID=33920 RepID=UPI0028FCFFD8|nr:ferredoxin reductase family protein [Saccharothrix longispora]MBY8849272.1 ferredoxin reductase family protein [Saccharothrix sp. MB29]MDU0293800.1 ferredoxin reductase family protein [Saccharothrix longispora]
MTTQLPAPAARTARPPAVRPKAVARAGLCAVLVANVAVVTALFLQAGPGVNALIATGRLTGLYAALLMAFQLLLVARLPWLDRRLGMDRLTSWHRWTGFSLLWLLLTHFVFILFGYAQVGELSPVDELVLVTTTVEGVLRAVVALVLIAVVGGVSARFARRRMAYETWHFIHLYTYLAVVLAFSHQVAVGTTFTASPSATAYWWGLWGVALGSVVLGRLVLPLWRNLRHRLRVSAVVPESDDVVSIHITGRDLDKLPARAGQFFLWRFLVKGRWWQANPFSLSAMPDGRTLRLTAKALGEGSASLRALAPGTRVFAEGPYGAFTALHRTRPDALLVAGGVGITPVRALLEELGGHLVVVYRVSRPQDAVLLDELRGLARARGAVLHVVTGPSNAPTPYGPPLGPGAIGSAVPDVRDRDVFVCGPPGMTGAVLRTMRELGVPKRQVHAERFSLAG